MYYAIAIIVGYLLGSVNPAYILGRILKQVDIRTLGSKNAGTTNTYKQLGFGPAFITGFYDFFKGLLCMYILYLLKAPELAIFLAGTFAIIGHIFPFYLKFHGGQGAATAVGMLIYLLIVLIKSNNIQFESLILLGLLVLAILIITHQKGFLALVVMPLLFFLVVKNYVFNYTTIFCLIYIAYIFGLNIYEARRINLFKFKSKTLDKVLVWRTLARPLASIFPILYFYFDRSIILWIVGLIGGLFLLFDIVRLLSTKINFFLFDKIKVIFKKQEKKRFSSITLFFLGSFVTILLFDKYIAITSLMFLIFGDVFAKFFGIEYGKTKIFQKTLEGSMAHLMICLVIAYLLWPYVNLAPGVLITGAIVATLAELIPSGINDNFIVPIASAVSMLIAIVI